MKNSKMVTIGEDLVLEQGVQCKYFRSENVRNTSVSLDICFKLVFAY
jgi:hypothetical protein